MQYPVHTLSKVGNMQQGSPVKFAYSDQELH